MATEPTAETLGRLVEGHAVAWKLTSLIDPPRVEGEVHPVCHRVHVMPSNPESTFEDLIVAIGAFCLDLPEAVSAYEVRPSWDEVVSAQQIPDRSRFGPHLRIQALPIPYDSELVLLCIEAIRPVIRLGVIELSPLSHFIADLGVERLMASGIDTDFFSLTEWSEGGGGQ